MATPLLSYVFFFNDTATTEIYTLSLHDALPISGYCRPVCGRLVAIRWRWRGTRDHDGNGIGSGRTACPGNGAGGRRICVRAGAQGLRQGGRLRARGGGGIFLGGPRGGPGGPARGGGGYGRAHLLCP